MGRSSCPTLSVPRGQRSEPQHVATRAASLLAGERLCDLLHEVERNHTGFNRGHTDHTLHRSKSVGHGPKQARRSMEETFLP